MKVVIPAAGLGTRFASQRLRMPKELLPLGSTPLIEHALAEAARAGFESATVVVSPAKHQLLAFLASDNFPIPVEVVMQHEAAGVGDAVLCGWRDEPIGVLLPDDVVLDTWHWTALSDKHRQSGAATLCVREVPIETTNRFGIAECDGDRVLSLVEKPPPGTSNSNLAIFGRYIVTEPVVQGMRHAPDSGELELTFGFAAAIASPPGVRAIRFTGRIYDCGTPSEYAASEAIFPG